MTTTRKSATYWTVKTIVALFMAGAAFVSFMHIVHTAAALGLGMERWTVPFIIDGLAVLGLIGRSARFAESTKRAGLKLTIGAGMLSLAANVAAGENPGQRIYGALIVAAFITAEWYGAKLSPAPQAQPAAPKTGKRCTEGCTCRKHARAQQLTPAQKRAITIAKKKADAELAAMVGGYVPADAPVSPAR